MRYKATTLQQLVVANNSLAGDKSFAILFDENGRLGIDLGVYGAPETFVINANNKIIYRHVGVVSEDVWLNKIKPMLNVNQGS